MRIYPSVLTMKPDPDTRMTSVSFGCCGAESGLRKLSSRGTSRSQSTLTTDGPTFRTASRINELERDELDDSEFVAGIVSLRGIVRELNIGLLCLSKLWLKDAIGLISRWLGCIQGVVKVDKGDRSVAKTCFGLISFGVSKVLTKFILDRIVMILNNITSLTHILVSNLQITYSKSDFVICLFTNVSV